MSAEFIMSKGATPREVFERLIAGIASGELAPLADLYAEDAVVEIVFEPVGPRRIVGREVLRERFAQAEKERPIELATKNVVVRETDDPEVVVAEFDYEVHHRGTGRTFEVANIQVLRVRDGLIVSTRDFHDHLGFAVGGNRLTELFEALAAK
ncbi:nuclear transport factor 2 family protein [Kitasatospora viridis]|uniref:Ketosteroid isomerase-like protein n=1 Tax=Kitasatospora viridis TaxID=281105 RepID=A0A561UAV5_9ACTN|nr:nuclear transport factor 2 family protein [Kitasatospora viridis]TWF96498.1 ketosteroid isomerase-like protein [Kitasatospora viridis]